MRHVPVAALVTCCVAACPASTDSKQATQTATQQTNQEPSLHAGFNNFTRSVTTASAEAQQWFDQGLQLFYGFDRSAAIAAFTQAVKLDPQCAMAWWGLAYAYGPNIDNPRMTPEQSKAAYDAVQMALKHVESAEPAERALVESLVQRYAWPAPENRKHLDEAFATAMREAWMKFPDDPEVSVAYAESLMIQHPHDYWSAEGQPLGFTEQIITILGAILVDWPSHPGANHYYILAVEGSADPMRGWRSSSLLQELVPGSGHLVHISSHIFLRLGHYARAADASERAVEADRAMYAQTPPSDSYRVQMLRHCAALADAAMTEARLQTAIDACRRIDAIADAEFCKRFLQSVDGLAATRFQVLVRFGKWDKILAEPEVPQEQLISRAMRHYARGAARAAMSDAPNARAELAHLDQMMESVTEDWLIGMHRASAVLPIMRQTLEARILIAENKFDEAVKTLQDAAALEDQIAFKSPRGWMVPVRHVLGALFLHLGRPADAEMEYRADLESHPHNGWAILGLRDALIAQGREADAQEFAAILPKAWARADVTPTSSCILQAPRDHSDLKKP